MTLGGERGGDRDADRGQAAVLGVVLVLGMVVAGTAVVVALGATALTDAKSASELERGENTMTLFNTRTSMVALGNSPSQTVAFGQDSGSVESDPDAGWLRVTHANYTGDGDDEVIFNESLGAVVYANDDTEVAYQGGGVWQKSARGESRMVSPPEFHYRDATLTLPVVRVGSTDAGSGGTTARIARASETRRVFPNATGPTNGTEIGAPYNGTDEPYENAITNGTVNVTVSSAYHHAWAEYFRDRTDGNVTEFPDQNRVRVTLESLSGSPGEFAMPAEGTDLAVRGLSGDHPIDNYTLTLASDPHFQNMHWSFYRNRGSEKFELHFYSDGKCNGDSYDEDIDVSIYYYNSTGSESIHEEWQNTSVNVGENDDFNVDCESGELHVDLMSDTMLTYGDIDYTGSDNKWALGDKGIDEPTPNSTSSFTFHEPDEGNYDLRNDETESLGFLVNHYFQLLGPNVDLQVTDGPGGSSRVDEGASRGELSFEAGGTQYVTYLHITENVVTVEFD